MNRVVSIVAIIFFLGLAIPVHGKDPSEPSSKNSIGKKSPDRFLYLYQKDPATWLRIKNGAWGKLTFNEYSAKFVLEAYGLVPRMAYAMIRATGPRPYAHVVAGWRTLSYFRRGKFGPSMPTDPSLEETK